MKPSAKQKLSFTEDWINSLPYSEVILPILGIIYYFLICELLKKCAGFSSVLLKCFTKILLSQIS